MNSAVSVFLSSWLNPSLCYYYQAFEGDSTYVSYHSKYCQDAATPTLCGFGFTPLKTNTQGPAAKCPDDQDDIVDEALQMFRAQVFFKNFQPEGPSDLTLIYLTCFINKCLEAIFKTPTKEAATKEFFKLTNEQATSANQCFMRSLLKHKASEDSDFKKYCQ